MSDPRHRDTRQVLHAAAPIELVLSSRPTTPRHHIRSSSVSASTARPSGPGLIICHLPSDHKSIRPHGPALRAGPNHPPSSLLHPAGTRLHHPPARPSRSGLTIFDHTPPDTKPATITPLLFHGPALPAGPDLSPSVFCIRPPQHEPFHLTARPHRPGLIILHPSSAHAPPPPLTSAGPAPPGRA